MYERHPVRIDKGRPLSANNGPFSSSSQVAFHKIYRKRRCYSIVDKEQEGHSSSQWRSGVVNPRRESNAGLQSTAGPSSRMNAGLQSNHIAGPSSRINAGLQSNHTAGPSSRMKAGLHSNHITGPSGRKTSRRVDSKSSSHSAAHSNIRSVKINQQQVKRLNDRLTWNSPSGLEFDVPVVKKQKPQCYNRNSASGPEFDAPFARKQKAENYDRLAWNSPSGPDFDAPFVKKQVVENYDRLAWNSPSGPEFDASFAKKQKVEIYSPTAPPNIVSPEARQGKQKMVLEDTKWMYKNQHAKMSGPYGVKQLIEGLHSHFLQEDLPIYQVHEGKLCQPIELRQLVDDLQGCNAFVQSPGKRSFSGQRFSRGASKEMPNKVAIDEDLPPGFGGNSVQLSEGPSCMYMPSSTALASGPQGCAGAFTSPVPDFREADSSLPPGFEAAGATMSLTEPHTTELSGSSRRLSTGAGLAVRSEGVRGMHLSYGKLEPNMLDCGHSSKHVSPPLSNVSFSVQAARILSENSSMHTAWAYTPSNTRALSFEAQTFSSPTVCIGLPVSQPAVQSWPVVNNLLSAVSKAEPYSFLDARIQVNNGLVPKEDSEFSVRHGPDPLALIQWELLAAVKRTYSKSVLRAVIGEQLEYWIDGGNSMGRSGLVEKDSYSRETCYDEVDVMSVEGNRFPIGALTALANPHIEAAVCSLEVMAAQCSYGSHLNTHSAPFGEYQCLSADASITRNNGSAYTSNIEMAAQCSEGSCLNSHSAHFGEYQCPSADASSMRNNGNTYTSNTVVDASFPSNTEETGLDTSRSFPSIGKAEEMPHYLEKAESCLSVDEASKLSLGNDSKHVILDLGVEIQHQSVDEILHHDTSQDKFQSSGNSSDSVVSETEQPFLTSGKKKGNVKSLKQLMLITSKLRSIHPKKRLLVNRKSKSSGRRGIKAEERRRRDRIVIPKDYDGCARTSINGRLWHDGAQQIHTSKSFEERDCSGGINGTESLRSIQPNGQTARTTRAQLRKLAADAKGFDILRLTQSKVHDRKLKFARSKIHDWGVFAVEPVEAGDFVIEYIGELVRSRVSDIREQRYKKLGIGSTYVFRIDNETVVDATMRGGLARFINHSCDPNCFTKIITLEGLKKICIYAKRHIEAGEELTYDYKLAREVQIVSCNCRSRRCRGYLS